MPQQLKIIVGPNYEVNAPFTVNFNSPVIVKPGNMITLDKFTANIRNITSNFALPESPFTFYYGLNFQQFQSSTVTIPGRTYTSLLDLLSTMSQLINNSFTGYIDGWENYPLTVYPYRDQGLKVVCSTTSTTSTSSSTTNVFQIQYNTSSFTLDESLTLTNFEAGVGGWAAPEAAGVWNLKSGTTLLKGGGIRLTFQINVAGDLSAEGNDLDYICGVQDTNQNFRGIQENNLGEIFLVYGNLVTGLTETQINPAHFFESEVGEAVQYYVDMYQVNGQWALRTYSMEDDDITTMNEIYNSNTSNPGALGAFDITQTYFFQAVGTNQVLNFAVPEINIQNIFSTPDINMTDIAPETVRNRTVAFDMTNSRALRAGLDVPSGQMILTPTDSQLAQFKCQTGINMSIINTAFDIAIEILDLPLQTYQASSDRKPGSRVNVVSYFHPELSNFGAGTYIYDSRANVWLDIDITYPLNLTSLSFRVYDPNTGVGIDASEMTFNLLISSTEY